MNFLSYWGFDDLRETWAGIYLLNLNKTTLHNNFVAWGKFIGLKFCLTKVLSNLVF